MKIIINYYCIVSESAAGWSTDAGVRADEIFRVLVNFSTNIYLSSDKIIIFCRVSESPADWSVRMFPSSGERRYLATKNKGKNLELRATVRRRDGTLFSVKKCLVRRRRTRENHVES